jgi:hypothetical protein
MPEAALDVESVNPNVSVGDEDHKEIRGGETVSFDDLEAVRAPDPSEGENEKEEAKAGGDDSKREAEDGSGPKQSDPTEEKEEEVEGERQTTDQALDPDAAPDPGQQMVRMFKAQTGEDELELSGDTVFSQKVAGKTEQVTLSEVLDNYSGKVNWDRKYNELHQQKVDVEKRSDEIEGNYNQLSTMIDKMVEQTKDDPLAFYDIVAEIHEVDPVSLKMQYIENLFKDLEHFERMSDNERQIFKERKKLEFERGYIDRQKSFEKQTKEEAARNQELANVREEYQLTEEEYRDAHDQASKYLTEQGRAPTTKEVIYADRYRKAMDLTDEIRSDWVKSLDATNEADTRNYQRFVEYVANLWMEPGTTKQDLTEIIQDAFGTNSAENLGRKVRKTQPSPQSNVGQPKTPKRNIVTSFDDL